MPVYRFRTKATHEAYQAVKEARKGSGHCALCKEAPTVSFEHWVIYPNDFPYDAIAKVHDLIVTKRHVTFAELNEAERAELEHLKQTYLNERYDSLIESLPVRQSIPLHAHYHLVISHDVIKE